MQSDDETLEILEPGATLAPILQDLDEALGRLAHPDLRPPLRALWDDAPFAEFAADAARLPLALEGWTDGVISSTGFTTGDLLHELSSDLGLMSAGDLNERFRMIVEGAAGSAEFRRVTEAPSLRALVRNDAGLGWSGFEVVQRNSEGFERMRRKRMTADRWRGVHDRTALRGWELVRGAALIVKARAADMIGPEAAEPYLRRVACELAVRCDSWHALARSALLGAFWEALDQSEGAADEALRRLEGRLGELLAPEGAWGARGWLALIPDAEPPEVL